MKKSIDVLSRFLTIFIVLFGVVGCAGSSLNPCGLVHKENDHFSGQTQGFTLYLDWTRTTALEVHEANGVYTIKALVVLKGASHAASAAGDKAEIAVGGHVFTVESKKAAHPVSNLYETMIITQWMIEYELTKEQIAELARAPLNAMRVHVGGETFVLEPSSFQARRIQNSVHCMVRSPRPTR